MSRITEIFLVVLVAAATMARLLYQAKIAFRKPTRKAAR